MIFRKAGKKDIAEVVEAAEKAFASYPLFQVYDLPRKQREFYRGFISLTVRTALKRGHVYVAEDAGQIIALACLHFPEDEPDTDVDFIRYGGRQMIRAGGRGDTKEFLHMREKVEAEAKSQPAPNYFLVLFGVVPERTGSGVGTALVRKCLMPLIARRGGGWLSLSTQDPKARSFFWQNGFVLVGEEQTAFKDQTVTSWTFRCWVEEE